MAKQKQTQEIHAELKRTNSYSATQLSILIWSDFVLKDFKEDEKVSLISNIPCMQKYPPHLAVEFSRGNCQYLPDILNLDTPSYSFSPSLYPCMYMLDQRLKFLNNDRPTQLNSNVKNTITSAYMEVLQQTNLFRLRFCLNNSFLSKLLVQSELFRCN